MADLFRAKWTDQIHDEWTRNLLVQRPDLSAEKLARTRQLMNAAVMDCLVTGYEPLIDSLTLPDKDDRHVLAAAIVCGADAIVTFNIKDFPPSNITPFNIEIQHPDVFIQNQFELDASKVVVAAQRCRARLKKPTMTVDDYLTCLERQGLPLSVAELRPYAAVL